MIIVPAEPAIVNVKVSAASAPNVTIQTAAAVQAQILQTLPSNVAIAVPGPQGPPGVQNVFVSSTPPPDPEINTIWIKV